MGLIKFYQLFLSSIFGGNCRFYPSCSDYAKEAYERHNVLAATNLTIRRLLKCYPLSPHKGVDLVPEKN